MHKQDHEFTRIFIEEKNNLLRYVKKKISGISEMDAEDIVADALFNVYNRLNADQYIENLLPYLYRSLQNKIFDRFRKPQHIISLDRREDNATTTWQENIRDDTADVEKIIIDKENILQLKQALLQLEAKQRAVWIATEIEGYSFKELSVQWQEPIGTLLARKSRANKIVKKLLATEKKEM